MSAKYYKRGQREYYQVTPERVIRLVNKEVVNEVMVVQLRNSGAMMKQYLAIFMSDIDEAKEISREEFAKEFSIAAKLIVLDPV